MMNMNDEHEWDLYNLSTTNSYLIINKTFYQHQWYSGDAS